MFQIVYVSSASYKMDEGELISLLKQNQQLSQEKNITGMLLYDDGNFFHVLEGEQSDVEDIFYHIKRDERNQGHIVILKEEIKNRTFRDWSMAFKRLTERSREKLNGFSEFLEQELAFSSETRQSQEVFSLLNQFKDCVSVH